MRRWIKALVLVVLLAAGALLVFRRAPWPISFTLSDGRVVEVAKITTGKVHRFRYGNRWQDYLGYYLPLSLRTNLHAQVYEYRTTNADALMVWTKSSPHDASSAFAIVVADEHGIEVPVAGDEVRFNLSIRKKYWSNLVPGDFIDRWPIAPLPTHARDITLGFYNRAYDKGGMNYRTNRPVAEVKIRNPAYHPEGALRPEKLPLVKTDGDVQVRLSRVDASVNVQDFRQAVDWTVNAELPADWRFEEIQVLDNAGQLVLSELAPWPWGPNLLHRFSGLWPAVAWKLRFRVTQEANFATNEIWVLDDVPANFASGTLVERHEVREINGMKAELLDFKAEPTLNGLSVPLTVRFSGPPPLDGFHITALRGWDEQGRAVGFNSSSPGVRLAMGAPTIYHFHLNSPRGAKSLTLEFAVHRSRYADFIVQPAWAGQRGATNSPGK